MLNFVKYLIASATKSDVALRRHLRLLRAVRFTILAVFGTLLIGVSFFAAGIAAALILAGIHPTVAIIFGTGGSATVVFTSFVKIRHAVRTWLKELHGRHVPMNDRPKISGSKKR
jgi:hypothetical protein